MAWLFLPVNLRWWYCWGFRYHTGKLFHPREELSLPGGTRFSTAFCYGSNLLNQISRLSLFSCDWKAPGSASTVTMQMLGSQVSAAFIQCPGRECQSGCAQHSMQARDALLPPLLTLTNTSLTFCLLQKETDTFKDLMLETVTACTAILTSWWMGSLGASEQATVGDSACLPELMSKDSSLSNERSPEQDGPNWVFLWGFVCNLEFLSSILRPPIYKILADGKRL